MPPSNPSAPLEIQYAQASNLGTLVDIEIRSFPSSNYMRSTYKGCDPRAVHTFKTVSALEYFAKPECHLLAGVLGGSDIIAYGRWHIPAIYGFERAVDTGLSSDAQAQMRDTWAYAPELNRGTYSFYEEMVQRSRGRHLRKTDFVLELLCVLPEYQRMGVGSAFLEWGIERADACNARIYLEATMEGVPAYLKHGWRVVEEVRLDYTERGGEGSQRFALMIREPGGVGLRE